MTPLTRTVQAQKAIAHPVRVRILAMLEEGALCGCQISCVTRLAPSTVSEHLAELRKAGVVAEKKDGRWVEYRLAPEGSTAAIVSAVLEEVANDPTIAADRVVVRALRRIPLDELCSLDLDALQEMRPSLANAVRRAEKLRAEG
jgi:ArsR family transcriptional regulator